jgi:hypothetical protein
VDEWLRAGRHEKEWRDTNARVEGPMEAFFLEDLEHATEVKAR